MICVVVGSGLLVRLVIVCVIFSMWKYVCVD